MIQQEYKNNVGEISGNVETTGFSIEVNESMFQMLTSNVYNDTILAVMREWSTNACDACIAAGKEVNFDVHLPTVEEPQFSVRDYGTGLPPEDIKGLFSNLGASTKRGSNAYNGTLGIGRMAGLAVANAFTVESFHNGKHYSYAISMQNGVPVTMHLGDVNTTEPNGLKLSVTVDTDDIGKYVERTPKLYKYFDHKPNLNKDINVELDVSEHISENWFIQKATSVYDRHNYVVMSQVAYQIPRNSAINTQGFLDLVIKAEPGAVTFNPGRESLSLNKATVEYLNAAFERIADEYVAAATAKLVTAENDRELMLTYRALTNSAPSKVAQKIDPEPYMSQNYKNLHSSYSYCTNTPSFRNLAQTDTFDTACNNMVNINYKTAYYRNSKQLKDCTTIDFGDFFSCNHVVIDLKTKFKQAFNEYYSNERAVIWQRKGSVDIDEAVEFITEYLDEMGIEYKLASELVEELGIEDTLKAPATPREGFYASNITSNGVYKSEKMEEWELESQKYLYVKLKNTTPTISNEVYSFNDYMEAYALLAKIAGSGNMPSIKGVAKKYQAVVEDLDNWVDFEQYIEEQMSQTIFKIPSTTKIPHPNRTLINDNTMYRYPKALRDYYTELRDYHEYTRDKAYIEYAHHISMAKQMGASFESYEPTKEVDLDYLESAFPKSYPMLTTRSYYDMTVDLLVHIAKLEEFYAIHSSK